MQRDAQRLEQAVEWLVKLEALGEVQLSPNDLQAWDEWAANDANRAAFDALAAVRQQLKAIPPLPWPSAAELQADRSSEVGFSEEETPVRPAHRPVAKARRSTLSFPLWGAVAAASAAVVVGLIVIFGYLPSRERSYVTQAGERRSIELPDGSTVALGAASSLSVHYTDHQRSLVLDRGEGLFEVKRDVTRPFRVRAGNGTITALGTRFNVRHGAQRVVVTVAEGLVEVAPAASRPGLQSEQAARWAPVRVAHDEEMSYGERSRTIAVKPTDSKIVTAWSQGTLVYRRRPLADVIEDVKRYWPREIALGAGVGDLLYSGTVGERNIPAWVRGLPEIFPVEVRELGAERVMIELRAP